MPRISTPTHIFSMALLSLTLTSAFHVQAASLEQQRTWYNQAQKAFDKKDMATFNSNKVKLGGYPLYPYLEYRAFNAVLKNKSPSQVKSFVSKYQALPFSQTIQSRYLSHLAQGDRWRDFLSMQPTAPKGTSLQCDYYYAKSQTGNPSQAWSGAQKLWQTGASLPDRCDPLLDAWTAAGKRTNTLVLERMLLAYQKGNKGLLVYLDKQLSGSAKNTGDKLLDLLSDPQGVATFAKQSKVTPFNQSVAEAAFYRLARTNVKQAVTQYDQVIAGQHFDKGKKQALADAVASRLMSTQDPALAKWRDNKLKTSQNVSMLERRIRNEIRESNWKETERWISRLPKEAKSTPRWRFWQAQVLANKGQKTQANKIYQSLLGERDFYSAAAATKLNKAITYPNQKGPTSTQLIQPYMKTLKRIGELVETDRAVAANREWAYLLSQVKGVQTKRQLAVYAEKHKWHHLAVQATISGKLWDHMALRFPVAHQWLFNFFSKERGVPAATMMALARQESALNIHAQSHVGARGLMQIMPATAQDTARKLGVKYAGKHTLFDPSMNIRLGSGYLKMMLERNDDNRIFSFASYNAGPGRVKQWRKVTNGQLDVYSFIEQIPFNETRGYVQNVLMFEIYYNALMGKKTPLFRTHELKARY